MKALGLVLLMISLMLVSVSADIQDEMRCQTDSDCGCGKHISSPNLRSTTCFVGNLKYVNTKDVCPGYCPGTLNPITRRINSKVIRCVKGEEDTALGHCKMVFPESS